MRNCLVILFLILIITNPLSAQTNDEGLVAWWKFDKVVEARPDYKTIIRILEKVVAEKTQVEILESWNAEEKKTHQDAAALSRSQWSDILSGKEEEIKKGLDEGQLVRYFYSDMVASYYSYSGQVDSELMKYWMDVATDIGGLSEKWKGKAVIESIQQATDAVLRNYWSLPGVSGDGLKFDGFATHIIREPAEAPQLGDAFTLEAWIAPQAYPWNWGAVVNQETDRKEGYFFGIDAVGHVGLHMAVDGEWVECTTETVIPFMEAWSHVTGVFDSRSGLRIYINGEEAASLSVKGMPTFAADANFQIGRNNTKLAPAGLVREWLSIPASYSFDGIIDELKIYNRSLAADEIKASYEKLKPADVPALTWRKLPQLPEGPSQFRAHYTNLKFYPEWDLLWPVKEHPDIVVTFDELPGKMVFWRGTNYNMNLVTENGRWVGDQSAETSGNWELSQGSVDDFPTGCMEHMSDKQNRYAHVRIIENNDARIVVHWRYACGDVKYRIAHEDPITGWGDWGDEYYYIYPDGVAIRHVTVHGTSGFSLTEPATFNQPGEKAEDNVAVEAVTIANLKGEIRTYSWDPWPGSGEIAADFDNPVPDANIAVLNFKSEYKPFYIYEQGTRIIPFGGGLVELRSEYSKFPTWNHWPVGQNASDGRFALAPDRVSSSAILSSEPPQVVDFEKHLTEARFILGLVDQSVEKLAPLARSWLQTPELQNVSKSFINKGYSRNQRAYILKKEGTKEFSFECTVKASQESPVVNPAFVIKNWGVRGAILKMNGKKIKRGKVFRYGHHHNLDSTDLIVWIKTESTKPMIISLSPEAE